MRDAVAFVVALVLILAAASLATSLQVYRRRRQRARDTERALGRSIIAELPLGEDLVLFSEDAVRFHYGDRSIDKDIISGARLMVNGAAIASFRSGVKTPPGRDPLDAGTDVAIDARPEGIARDRWDVVIDTLGSPVVVECGAIRERVSQELGRAIYEAVKRAAGLPTSTTPFPERPHDD